ncbi:MAG TPA: DUF5679 domain-containing protein [Armatimonadota bacterium]|jgi:hypothetical protein
MAIAYCLGCKANREVKDSRYETAVNGVRYVKGVCSVCGRHIARLLGKPKANGKGDLP